jgi:hypothetical protein
MNLALQQWYRASRPAVLNEILFPRREGRTESDMIHRING